MLYQPIIIFIYTKTCIQACVENYQFACLSSQLAGYHLLSFIYLFERVSVRNREISNALVQTPVKIRIATGLCQNSVTQSRFPMGVAGIHYLSHLLMPLSMLISKNPEPEQSQNSNPAIQL